MQKETSLKRKAPDGGDRREVKSKPATGKPEFKKPAFGSKPAFGKPGFNNKPGGNRFGKPGQYGNNKPYNRNGQGGGGGRQFNGNNKPAEKQDWNKLKADKKELKIKRKERRIKDKDIYELTFQAKKIYEKLKCKTEKNRPSLADELHQLLRNKNIYAKLVLAHDTARVVQCLFKVAPSEIKVQVLKELLPSVPQMASSKYSHFCIAAVLKHGTSEMRDQVINALSGHIVKLTAHSLASSLLDSVYVTWASNKQRAAMRQEFYSDLYKRDKDPNVKCIADVHKTAPHMKKIVLDNLKQHIVHMANKKLTDNSLFHSVISDYLSECSDEDRSEVCGILASQLASLASTKEGAKAASQLFYYLAAKERRAAIKSLKDHVAKLCVHEFGYYLVIAILHTIDDTKMLKKYILDVIVASLDAMVVHEWGRKILEFLVVPGDSSIFHPQFMAELNKGLINSKKDTKIRQQEILEACELDLLTAIKKNPDYWLNSGHVALTTATILKACAKHPELLAEVHQALAKVIVNVDWYLQPNLKVNEPEEGEKSKKILDEDEEGDGEEKEPVKAKDEDEEEVVPKKKFKKKVNPMEEAVEAKKEDEKLELGVEDAGLHIALKRLIKEDKVRQPNQQSSLCSALVKELARETILKWIGINRSCFLLINLLENSPDDDQKALTTSLKGVAKELKAQSNLGGAKILLQKIQ